MKFSIWHMRATGTACALLAIAACEPVVDSQQAQAPSETPVAATPQATEVEVATPRPDLYSVRALAAWDGRPSLGGAWIAHPDVASAERASITEVATGRTITAALFRRDPSIPGPPFQLSADAAQQLGIQPGVSVELDVVAVRMTTVTAPQPTPIAEPTVEHAVAEADSPTPEPVEQVTPVETVATTVPEPRPEPTPPPAPTSAPTTDAAPERPYMQVGTFGVAANAAALVERLQAEGLNAKTVAAGALTRVVVGPASTTAEQAVIRDTLREMGFTDALAVAL
ncbi:Sporulation related domain-containing protein [Monaibacterium marinum]|uniref:Sporulation related domain-containing protein n=1 Tax=Pontivivens marinum TaxID=1690039 RepID=A0A2C9CLU9_9RHOB|nr:SPOR domain-containing protein [Monaibacterium marinum]SOH92165.1 Sporulation related domain-containing protein [Monaibacterium marinum]